MKSARFLLSLILFLPFLAGCNGLIAMAAKSFSASRGKADPTPAPSPTAPPMPPVPDARASFSASSAQYAECVAVTIALSGISANQASITLTASAIYTGNGISSSVPQAKIATRSDCRDAAAAVTIPTALNAGAATKTAYALAYNVAGSIDLRVTGTVAYGTSGTLTIRPAHLPVVERPGFVVNGKTFEPSGDMLSADGQGWTLSVANGRAAAASRAGDTGAIAATGVTSAGFPFLSASLPLASGTITEPHLVVGLSAIDVKATAASAKVLSYGANAQVAITTDDRSAGSEVGTFGMARLDVRAPGHYDICNPPTGTSIDIVLGTQASGFTLTPNGNVSIYVQPDANNEIHVNFRMDCVAAGCGPNGTSYDESLPANLYLDAGSASAMLAGSLIVGGDIFIGSLEPGHVAGANCP